MPAARSGPPSAGGDAASSVPLARARDAALSVDLGVGAPAEAERKALLAFGREHRLSQVELRQLHFRFVSLLSDDALAEAEMGRRGAGLGRERTAPRLECVNDPTGNRRAPTRKAMSGSPFARNNNTSYEEALALGELRANPFAPRILELFSEDGSGSLTFENLVAMVSALNGRGSTEEQVIWAFALWDLDGDDVIGREDVRCGLDLLTNGAARLGDYASARLPQGFADELGTDRLNGPQLDALANALTREADPDGNGIEFNEFRRLAATVPDLLWCIRLRGWDS